MNESAMTENQVRQDDTSIALLAVLEAAYVLRTYDPPIGAKRLAVLQKRLALAADALRRQRGVDTCVITF